MKSTGMKTRVFGLAVAVTIGVTSTAAQAQISPFSGRGPKMGLVDLDRMDKAAAPLFQGEGFTPGSVAKWNNPASGWSGTVTAKGTTKVSGCHAGCWSITSTSPSGPTTVPTRRSGAAPRMAPGSSADPSGLLSRLDTSPPPPHSGLKKLAQRAGTRGDKP